MEPQHDGKQSDCRGPSTADKEHAYKRSNLGILVDNAHRSGLSVNVPKLEHRALHHQHFEPMS
jgi:hypothetical protein